MDIPFPPKSFNKKFLFLQKKKVLKCTSAILLLSIYLGHLIPWMESKVTHIVHCRSVLSALFYGQKWNLLNSTELNTHLLNWSKSIWIWISKLLKIVGNSACRWVHFWKVGIEKSWQMGTLKQHGVFFDLHSIFYSFMKH